VSRFFAWANNPSKSVGKYLQAEWKNKGFFGSELSAPLFEKVKFVLGFFPAQMQVKQTLEMPREVPTYRHLVNMCQSPHPASSWHDRDVWPLHQGVVNRFRLFQLQRPICSTIIHWV
jgi:hypothetical protein